jgi:para-nitrobenzyl esterase
MGTEVETRYGRIRGRDREGIRVFRGVPYARAPTGAQRLRPPEPPESWRGVREALRAADVAPQNQGAIEAMMGAKGQRSSEDCLALNLWTPGLDAARRPVLVWLHGGGFTTGSGALRVYDGRRLARRGDAVVVTINYRLGALGYLALPALAREEGGALGNLGLLDQLAALRWVREHVAHFGGDPENVTLFGESAGAMSAATLLATPAARGLFRRVVLQSGAASHVHDREDGLRVAETFMRELALAPDDVPGLRAAPVDAVLAAQARCAAALAGVVRTVAFQPVVDGEVLPHQPLAAVREGSASAVPMLIGTNRDEWKLFGLGDRRVKALDEAALLRRCARNIPGRDAAGRSFAERVIEDYREARVGRASVEPRELWFAIESDRHFRWPATQLAEAHARWQPRTYAYLFTWESRALGGALGACHALEVPFVFGCVADGVLAELVGDPPGARSLSERMQDAWLAFARTDDPAHPGLGEWPAYQGERRSTMILGATCEVACAPLEAERAIWEEIA